MSVMPRGDGATAPLSARALSIAGTLTALALIGAGALIGCGSTRAQPVATVQGAAISRAALAHWTQIKRAELRGAPASTSSGARRRALVFLITADWLQGEARSQGIEVPFSEADATFRELLHGPTGQAFAASLRSHGISSADELLLLHLQQLSGKLRAKIAAGHSGAAAARRVATFVSAYRRRWKLRTTCAPGYVVAECRNGPPLPVN
jgi:hypothetical protein